MKFFSWSFVALLSLGFAGCAGQKKAIESDPILAGEQSVPMQVAQDVEHYVVEFGDTLWDIAAAKYHDAFQWPILYHANRDQISNPDLIEVGQRLVIPRAPSLAASARQEASDWPPYHKHRKHRSK